MSYGLWNVEIEGLQGINLKPIEPFGDHFVYHTTERVARELGIFAHQDRGGYSGTKTVIKRSTTVEQARELRRKVLAIVEEKGYSLNLVKKALEGIDEAIDCLQTVKKALEE